MSGPARAVAAIEAALAALSRAQGGGRVQQARGYRGGPISAHAGSVRARCEAEDALKFSHRRPHGRHHHDLEGDHHGYEERRRAS